MASTPNRKLREENREPRHVTVWLGKEDFETTFWCSFCRKGLIQHKQRIIAIISDHPSNTELNSPPISVQCSSCSNIFHFQGFI